MTVCFLGDTLTNRVTEAAHLAGLDSHTQYKVTKAPQPKHHKPEQVNSNCCLWLCSTIGCIVMSIGSCHNMNTLLHIMQKYIAVHV